MNKKIIILISFILILCIGGCIFFVNHHLEDNKKYDTNPNNNNNSNEDIQENDTEKEGENMTSDKSIVVYFSATGTTKKIAEFISEATNSSTIEIIPMEEYTDNDLNYNNNNSRANKEQNDSSFRPEIKNKIDVTNYDTIYLGYPIWWGDVPKIILTFIENNNLEGKKIIPFCTSHSSGMSTSLNTLKSYKNLNIVDGRRFSSSSTKSNVEYWLKGIK